MITRDAPEIAACLALFRPYVSQIVVVDTGSKTEEGFKEAKRIADTHLVFTDCNEKAAGPNFGAMNDFALARNKSFSLAVHDVIVWADSDDELEGLENLAVETSLLLETAEDRQRVMVYGYPYETSYEADGRPAAVRQAAARLLSRGAAFVWKGRVHEQLVPRPGVNVHLEARDSIVWKHRQKAHPDREGRNLRILLSMEKEEPDNPRTLYCLGREYRRPSQRASGGHRKAECMFLRCLEETRGRTRRAMVMLELFEIALEQGSWQLAHSWALRAHAEASRELAPVPERDIAADSWSSYGWRPGLAAFAVALSYQTLAKEKEYKGLFSKAIPEWKECIRYFELSHAEQKVVEEVTHEKEEPLDRILQHRALHFFHEAYAAVGDWPKASEVCKIALRMYPGNASLIKAKLKYQKMLDA